MNHDLNLLANRSQHVTVRMVHEYLQSLVESEAVAELEKIYALEEPVEADLWTLMTNPRHR